MDPRIAEHPTNGLRVLVVDEDKDHANYMRAILPQHNYHAIVFTSPRQALNFLNDHEQDVDFLLVAVEMEEISGFEFLDMAVKKHGMIQVIMMSTTTTIDVMRRCVELGGRFLEKKPLDSVAIRNLWQYLDIRDRKIEMIQNLFRGPRAKTNAEQSNATNSFADKEFVNNNISEVQSSVGSNTINMDLPDSEDGEIVEKDLEGDQGSEVGAPPSN